MLRRAGIHPAGRGGARRRIRIISKLNAQQDPESK
jgi:hypothetical protein